MPEQLKKRVILQPTELLSVPDHIKNINPNTLVRKLVLVVYTIDNIVDSIWINVLGVNNDSTLIGKLEHDCKHSKLRRGSRVIFSSDMISCVWNTEEMLKSK